MSQSIMSNVYDKLTFRLLDELHCISLCDSIRLRYVPSPSSVHYIFSQSKTNTFGKYFYCFDFFIFFSIFIKQRSVGSDRVEICQR